MSTGRLVISIDDDESSNGENVGKTTERQVQKLVRDLNEARTTIAYLRVDLSSIQAENTRLQAENSRYQARFARLRAYLQDELLDDPGEDTQFPPNVPGGDRIHSRRSRVTQQENHPPKKPRTQPQDSVNVRRDILDGFANNSPLDEHEEADKKITVRVNQDGELETDSHVDGQAWIEFEEAWQDIKRQFDSKSGNWTSADLKEKCVWGAVVSAPTSHYWTRDQPGKFACRSCANTRRICVGRIDGSLQLLPLPPVPESARHTVTDLISKFVAEEDHISRRARPVWP